MEQPSEIVARAFLDELRSIQKTAKANWTPAHIYKIAKHLGIDCHGEEFKAFSKSVVGKDQLDEMNRAELQKLAVALVRKSRGSKTKQANLLMQSMKKITTPQVSRALQLKPPTPATNAIKVPGAVAAHASTATNVQKLKGPAAVYGK